MENYYRATSAIEDAAYGFALAESGFWDASPSVAKLHTIDGETATSRAWKELLRVAKASGLARYELDTYIDWARHMVASS